MMMTWFYNLDVNILTYVQDSVRNGTLTYFFEEITDLGNSGWFWIILGLAMLAVKRTRITGLLVLAAVVASGAGGTGSGDDRLADPRRVGPGIARTGRLPPRRLRPADGLRGLERVAVGCR